MYEGGLLGEYNRLQSRNLETFAAAQVLAAHHVVLAEHVRFRFGKAGAIPLVGMARQLFSLGAHQPSDFIVGGLVAMWTVQSRRLLFRTLVEKIALFHRSLEDYCTHWDARSRYARLSMKTKCRDEKRRNSKLRLR